MKRISIGWNAIIATHLENKNSHPTSLWIFIDRHNIDLRSSHFGLFSTRIALIPISNIRCIQRLTWDEVDKELKQGSYKDLDIPSSSVLYAKSITRNLCVDRHFIKIEWNVANDWYGLIIHLMHPKYEDRSKAVMNVCESIAPYMSP